MSNMESERINEEMVLRDLLTEITEQTNNKQALYYIKEVFRNNLWGDDLLIQCKYIFSNLKGWRGKDARHGKLLFNDYITKYTGLPFFQGKTYPKKSI